MTKIIGLTGGIGSGKSTAAGFFIELGVPVYFADAAAREIMETPEMIAVMRAKFGELVISDGKLNRKALGEIVFNNPKLLKDLNEIVHPAVKKHFDIWVRTHQAEPFIIKEAAILFESGSYKYCDKIICVVASEEVRIDRVQKRDSLSSAEVHARIRNQWTDNQRIEKSDYIITNTTLKALKSQISTIFHKLQALY